MIVRVLHFDDEPTPVRWIPDALIEHLLAKVPGSVKVTTDESDDDDSTVVAFDVAWSENQKITIEYRLESNIKQFRDRFDTAAPDVVILDVMDEEQGELKVGEPRNGVKLFNWINEGKISGVKVMFLTGYRDELNELVNTGKVANTDVFSKAPSMQQFISRLTQHIESAI